MARLRVVSGPNAGQTVDVDEEIVIGREDTDLAIDDEEMSGRHAVVRRHANRLQVEDLGSTTGTFVDGTRIAEPTLLGGGAEIKVGATVLVVEGVLPVPDPSGDIAPRNVTRVSAAIVDGPPPPAALAQPPAAPPAVALPRGAHTGGGRVPTARPQSQAAGLASRSWVPVALSFGTVILGGDRARHLLQPAHVIRTAARAPQLRSQLGRRAI